MERRQTKMAVAWREDGLGRTQLKKGVNVCLADAVEYLGVCRELAGGGLVPVLVDIRHAGSIDLAARKYLSGPVAAEFTKAAGILVGSAFSRVVGNTFLHVARPAYPTRLFTSEEEALTWLRAHL